MTHITPSDISTQWPAILSRVARGEGFVVTDGRRPLARILPPTDGSRRAASAAGADSWRPPFAEWMEVMTARADRYPPGFALDDRRDGIDAGRGM